MEHINYGHCSHCQKKLSFKDWLANQGRRLVGMLCAACLSIQLLVGQYSISPPMDAVNQDFEASVDFMMSSTAATTDISGDQMIHFVTPPKIEHPENIQIKRIGDSPR